MKMCINKNEELLPYYERARDILKYNPKTGIFTRFIKCRNTYEVVRAGSDYKYKYCQIGITLNGNHKVLTAHRIAWFISYGELPNIIDHINRNPRDNRIDNLRSCTPQENNFNSPRPMNNTSGRKGVCWNKQQKKWRARIKHNGKIITLGFFDCLEEASKAYESKAMELHGEYYYKQNKE